MQLVFVKDSNLKYYQCLAVYKTNWTLSFVTQIFYVDHHTPNFQFCPFQAILQKKIL